MANKVWMKGAALVGGLALFGAACDYAQDLETLTVVDANEDGLFSNGDEPYLSVYTYRVTIGEAGSTEVAFAGGTSEIANGMNAGDSVSISGPGDETFTDLTFGGYPDVEAGFTPTVFGEVIVALEDDFGSVAQDMSGEVVAAVATTLQANFEGISGTGNGDRPADVAAFTGNMATVRADVNSGVITAYNNNTGIFTDDDDLIGVGMTMYATAAGQFGFDMDAAMAAAFSGDEGVSAGTADGGPPGDGEGRPPETIRMSGSDAVYDVTLSLANLDSPQ
jgi:hypothetical protein